MRRCAVRGGQVGALPTCAWPGSPLLVILACRRAEDLLRHCATDCAAHPPVPGVPPRSMARADSNNCFCCCTSGMEVAAPGTDTCIHGFSCSNFCRGAGFANVLSCPNAALKPYEPTLAGPTARASAAFLVHLTLAYGAEASPAMKVRKA